MVTHSLLFCLIFEYFTESYNLLFELMTFVKSIFALFIIYFIVCHDSAFVGFISHIRLILFHSILFGFIWVTCVKQIFILDDIFGIFPTKRIGYVFAKRE